jgi:hypothetical protein
MTSRPPGNLIDEARRRLASEWQRSISGKQVVPSVLPPEVAAAIQSSINSKTKTYRYVLPTQLLAKLVDASLDCRCVQATCGLPGAFDARSVCQDVVVPFDRSNNAVLGGSTEPYANNPLRIPAITQDQKQAQKDKEGFEALRLVLEYAQSNPGEVLAIFRAVLLAIRERLEHNTISYPVPNRVSLKHAQISVATFLGERSGGLRLQTIAVALFSAVGKQLGAFASVISADINAADSSTGSAADLECLDESGSVVLAVEVKDRKLTLRHAEDKLPGMREKGIRELLFLVQGGVESADANAVESLVDQQFVTGQNIYVCDFNRFTEYCLILLGESGRRLFMKYIGEQLEACRADFAHRKAWADILHKI